MKVLKTVVSKHGTTRKNASARTHMCLNLYDLLSCYIYFAFPSFCGGTLMTLFFFYYYYYYYYYLVRLGF